MPDPGFINRFFVYAIQKKTSRRGIEPAISSLRNPHAVTEPQRSAYKACVNNSFNIIIRRVSTKNNNLNGGGVSTNEKIIKTARRVGRQYLNNTVLSQM